MPSMISSRASSDDSFRENTDLSNLSSVPGPIGDVMNAWGLSPRRHLADEARPPLPTTMVANRYAYGSAAPSAAVIGAELETTMKLDAAVRLYQTFDTVHQTFDDQLAASLPALQVEVSKLVHSVMEVADNQNAVKADVAALRKGWSEFHESQNALAQLLGVQLSNLQQELQAQFQEQHAEHSMHWCKRVAGDVIAEQVPIQEVSADDLSCDVNLDDMPVHWLPSPLVTTGRQPVGRQPVVPQRHSGKDRSSIGTDRSSFNDKGSINIRDGSSNGTDRSSFNDKASTDTRYGSITEESSGQVRFEESASKDKATTDSKKTGDSKGSYWQQKATCIQHEKTQLRHRGQTGQSDKTCGTTNSATSMRSQFTQHANAVNNGSIPDVAWDTYCTRMRANAPAVENLVEVLGWDNQEEPIQNVPSNPQLSRLGCVRDVIRSPYFSGAVLLLILSNACVVALQTDQHMKRAIKEYKSGHSQPEPTWYNLVDTVYCIVFTVELLLRMTAEEHFFCKGPEKWWNLLDVCLVASAVLELIATKSSLKISYMRILRCLRAIRALRIVRAVRFLKELRVMLMSVINSLTSLFWAFTFLFCVVFLFGVIFLQAASNFIQNADAADDPTVRSLYLHFRSMPQTVVSLFASTSGGMDWQELFMPLNNISESYGFLMIFYISFMSIGILNVIVGIFVEGASDSAKQEKENTMKSELYMAGAHMQELKEYLETFDSDGSGTISAVELQTFLSWEGVKPFLELYEIDEKEAQGLFRLLACSGDEATIDEFVVGLQILKGGNSIHVASQWYETRKLMTQITNFIKYTREHFTFIEAMLQGLDEKSETGTNRDSWSEMETRDGDSDIPL